MTLSLYKSPRVLQSTMTFWFPFLYWLWRHSQTKPNHNRRTPVGMTAAFW